MSAVEAVALLGGRLLDGSLVVAWGLTGGLLLGWARQKAWTHRVARQGSGLLWVLITGALGLLLWGLVSGQFALRYVAAHTSLDLSPFYRVTALW